VNGYNPIIPNELQKYFHDKRIENSYIKKLSILSAFIQTFPIENNFP
jgi:hypothetical protein